MNFLSTDNKLLEENSNFLDVGCYDGDFLSKLPDTIHKYGVDIDKNAIERGQKKYSSKNIQLYCHDFKSFDNGGITFTGFFK